MSIAKTGIQAMNTPEAYEKLLYDCMRGDATNFTHWDEVAFSWNFVDTISEAWENTKEKLPELRVWFYGTKRVRRIAC